MMSIVTVQNTESIPPHSVNLPSTLAIVSGPMALTIVADDLTAACDTGTLFAGQAPVPVTVWPAAPVAAKVTVVDTESRHIDRAAAAARVRSAAERRPAARVGPARRGARGRRDPRRASGAAGGNDRGGGRRDGRRSRHDRRRRAHARAGTAPRRRRRPGTAPRRAPRPPCRAHAAAR